MQRTRKSTSKYVPLTSRAAALQTTQGWRPPVLFPADSVPCNAGTNDGALVLPKIQRSDALPHVTWPSSTLTPLHVCGASSRFQGCELAKGNEREDQVGPPVALYRSTRAARSSGASISGRKLCYTPKTLQAQEFMPAFRSDEQSTSAVKLDEVRAAVQTGHAYDASQARNI